MILPTWNESHLRCLHRLAALDYAKIDTDDKNHTPSSTFQNSEEIHCVKMNSKSAHQSARKGWNWGTHIFMQLVMEIQNKQALCQISVKSKHLTRKKFLNMLPSYVPLSSLSSH